MSIRGFSSNNILIFVGFVLILIGILALPFMKNGTSEKISYSCTGVGIVLLVGGLFILQH